MWFSNNDLGRTSLRHNRFDENKNRFLKIENEKSFEPFLILMKKIEIKIKTEFLAKAMLVLKNKYNVTKTVLIRHENLHLNESKKLFQICKSFIFKKSTHKAIFIINIVI